MTVNELEYRRRKENTDFLDTGIKVIEKSIKEKIRKIATELDESVIDEYLIDLDSLNVLLTGLTGVWTESTIKHLVLDNGIFDLDQANSILSQKSMTDKWLMAHKCAVTNAYIIPTNRTNKIASKNEIVNYLDDRSKKKFQQTHDIIEVVIDNIREFRNKVQHGDWMNGYVKNTSTNVYEFNASVSSEMRQRNILTERIRRHQVKQIYLLIFDLYSFRHLGKFEKDRSSSPSDYFYPKRYSQIKRLESEIQRADISKYINVMINKERRGINWRNKNASLVSRLINWLKI